MFFFLFQVSGNEYKSLRWLLVLGKNIQFIILNTKWQKINLPLNSISADCTGFSEDSSPAKVLTGHKIDASYWIRKQN